jgi:hypothetical protein
LVVFEPADAAGEPVEAFELRCAEVAEAFHLRAEFTSFTPGTAGKNQRTDGHDEGRRGDDHEKENEFIHDAAHSAGKRDGGKLIIRPRSLMEAMLAHFFVGLSIFM